MRKPPHQLLLYKEKRKNTVGNTAYIKTTSLENKILVETQEQTSKQSILSDKFTKRENSGILHKIKLHFLDNWEKPWTQNLFISFNNVGKKKTRGSLKNRRKILKMIDQRKQEERLTETKNKLNFVDERDAEVTAVRGQKHDNT